MDLFQHKGPHDIRQCLIWYFNFSIERRCIPICSFNYDVQVTTCLNITRISCQWNISVHSDEWKKLSWFLNRVTSNLSISRGELLFLDGNSKGCEVAEHIDIKFKVNPRMISALKKRKIHLKHEPRRKCVDINGQNYGVFSFLVKDKNRAGVF